MRISLRRVCVLLFLSPAWTSESKHQLLERLFSNYDPSVRPGMAAFNESCGVQAAPEQVEVQVKAEKLHSIDEKKMSISVDGYLSIW